MTAPRLHVLGSEASLPAPEPVATTLYYLRAMRDASQEWGGNLRNISGVRTFDQGLEGGAMPPETLLKLLAVAVCKLKNLTQKPRGGKKLHPHPAGPLSPGLEVP